MVRTGLGKLTLRPELPGAVVGAEEGLFELALPPRTGPRGIADEQLVEPAGEGVAAAEEPVAVAVRRGSLGGLPGRAQQPLQRRLFGGEVELVSELQALVEPKAVIEYRARVVLKLLLHDVVLVSSRPARQRLGEGHNEAEVLAGDE